MANTENKNPNSAVETAPKAAPSGGKSDRSWVVVLILSFFLGALGIHRFYVGKIGTGIVWLLTGGCLGVGWLIDFIRVLIGNFTDKEGNAIKNN